MAVPTEALRASVPEPPVPRTTQRCRALKATGAALSLHAASKLSCWELQALWRRQDFQRAQSRVYRRLFALWKKTTAERTRHKAGSGGRVAAPPAAATHARCLYPRSHQADKSITKTTKSRPSPNNETLKYTCAGVLHAEQAGGGAGGREPHFPSMHFYFSASAKGSSCFNVNYLSLSPGQAGTCKRPSQVKRSVCLGAQMQTNRSIFIWGWKTVKWG